MKVFNDIRLALLDPTKGNEREEIADRVWLIKGGSYVLMGITGTLAGISAVSMRTFPKLGAFCTLLSGAAFVASHEVMTLARNTETMTSSTTQRFAASLSEQEFINRLMTDTWVVGPLLGTKIARELRKAKS